MFLFVNNVKISEQFLSEKDRGKLTDIVLHLHGDHQFAVDDGDYFLFLKSLILKF